MHILKTRRSSLWEAWKKKKLRRWRREEKGRSEGRDILDHFGHGSLDVRIILLYLHFSTSILPVILGLLLVSCFVVLNWQMPVYISVVSPLAVQWWEKELEAAWSMNDRLLSYVGFWVFCFVLVDWLFCDTIHVKCSSSLYLICCEGYIYLIFECCKRVLWKILYMNRANGRPLYMRIDSFTTMVSSFPMVKNKIYNIIH